MADKIIPAGEPAQGRQELQELANNIDMVAADVGIACELLEDAFGCMGGDRLQRGQVAMLIYAISAKAKDLDGMANELHAHCRAQMEVSHV